jgi:CheY-like chemotaxis protein
MIEAGKISLNQTEFDLKEVIKHTIDAFRPLAGKKDLRIILNDEQVESNSVYGDHFKLSQILLNLISNAIKFTEEGSVMVILKSEISGSKTNVELTVEDTGIGIDHEMLENIFVEFEQLEYYLTKKTMGTGLGLAITRKLIQLMNGDISVESESGKGSRFKIQIPFETRVNQKTEVIMNNPEESRSGKGGDIKILLAEDNEANQFLIKAITKSENWDIMVVDDGEQAVNAYRNNDFDLILMDVQMPVMNGYEATRIIRKDEEGKDKHIPIIALTAYAMKSDKDQCIAAGMDSYISKPFKKQQFLDTIYDMLDKD